MIREIKYIYKIIQYYNIIIRKKRKERQGGDYWRAELICEMMIELNARLFFLLLLFFFEETAC